MLQSKFGNVVASSRISHVAHCDPVQCSVTVSRCCGFAIGTEFEKQFDETDAAFFMFDSFVKGSLAFEIANVDNMAARIFVQDLVDTWKCKFTSEALDRQM